MAAPENRGVYFAACGIALVFAATVLAYLPASVLGIDAAPTEFSAGRALQVLQDLVGDNRPHPLGSVANAAVRTAIVSKLAALGYATEVQTGLVCNPRGGCGTPNNIVATLKDTTEGMREGDSVLLAAHYDSVAAGPGASDDGAGVAAALEIARVLAATHAPRPRHPIIILISDGEEPGLLGALLFVREHPLAKQVKAAVNMEARGVSGPSLMFETGSANAWLMQLYARTIDRPLTNSLYYMVYNLLPNDTDFTVFKAAQYQGFNFAFIDHTAFYHTPLDNVANVSAASIQEQGASALSTVMALANSTDLNPPPSESVFFDVFERALIVLPAKAASPIALVLLIVLMLQTAILMRRGIASARHMAWGLVGVAANLALGTALCAALIALLWSMGKVPPFEAGPWIAHPFAMSAAAAAIAVLSSSAISAWLVKRAGIWGFWLGASLSMALLSVVLSVLNPGPSFPLLLTVMAAVLCVLPAMMGPADAGGARAEGLGVTRVAATALGRIEFACLIPGLALFAVLLPMLRLLYSALGATVWPVMTFALCLAASYLLPLLAAARDRLRRRLAASAAAVVVAGMLATFLLPTFSAAWPQRLNIEYWVDADTDSAHWWVQAASLHLPPELAGVSRFEATPRPRFPGTTVLGFVAPAARLALPAPELGVTSSARSHYELTLRSARGAPKAFIIFPASANIHEATISTRIGALRVALPTLRNGATRLTVTGLPTAGMEFAIDSAAAPGAVQIFDESYGLPGELPTSAALEHARPQNATSSQDGDVTMIGRTVKIGPAAGR
jgi:Peptidase family M28